MFIISNPQRINYNEIARNFGEIVEFTEKIFEMGKKENDNI